MTLLKFTQLDQDAPEVPEGLRPKRGVEYGCGQADCEDCYEPNPSAAEELARARAYQELVDEEEG